MCVLAYIGVTNLRNDTVTTSEITVMWDHAVSPSGCGPVLYYIVTAVNLAYASDMESRKNVAEISNLSNGVSYNISVSAVNRAGTGPSSVITVTTLSINEKSKQ